MGGILEAKTPLPPTPETMQRNRAPSQRVLCVVTVASHPPVPNLAPLPNRAPSLSMVTLYQCINYVGDIVPMCQLR